MGIVADYARKVAGKRWGFVPNRYLSNENLPRRRHVSFYPQADTARASQEFKRASGFDRLKDESVKFFGKPAVPLGTFRSIMPGFPGYKGIYIVHLAVKKPGEIEHRLPVALHRADPRLRDILQRFATHQFANSAYALGKVGELMIRKVPATEKTNQIGDIWHVDDGIVDDDKKEEYKKSMGLKREDWDSLDQEGGGLLSHNYNISDSYSTWVQAGMPDESLPIFSYFTNLGHITCSDVAPPHRQAHPHEAIFYTSEVFHKAAEFNTNAPNQNQQSHRTLVILQYKGTETLEAQFRRDMRL